MLTAYMSHVPCSGAALGHFATGTTVHVGVQCIYSQSGHRNITIVYTLTIRAIYNHTPQENLRE
jgi:hypothetical protein